MPKPKYPLLNSDRSGLEISVVGVATNQGESGFFLIAPGASMAAITLI